MSNERIDLTRFEWMISDHRKEAEEKTGITLLDLDAIAMVPEFIAELKRCYEELDELRIGLNMAHRCLVAHNFRQCGECGDHYHDDYGPLCGHTASQ